MTTAWSTRCIHPVSLRKVNRVCGGRKNCSVSVSSSQFGDPCPGTPKYLELVYSCQAEVETAKYPELPEWILNLKSMPKSTTLKAKQTTTEKNVSMPVEESKTERHNIRSSKTTNEPATSPKTTTSPSKPYPQHYP